jgi:hypothetical protein
MFGIDIVRFIWAFLTKITTIVRENRMDNQERTIHADTLASFGTLFIKFDLYRISFYSGFGLDMFHCIINLIIKQIVLMIIQIVRLLDLMLSFQYSISLQNKISEDSRWHKGPSWSWSYGGWIYIYLCNRCLSPLGLWVRIPLTPRCTRCNIMWWSLSVTCGRSVVFTGYSCFLDQ